VQHAGGIIYPMHIF